MSPRTIFDDDQIERAETDDHGVVMTTTDTTDVVVSDDDGRIQRLAQILARFKNPFDFDFSGHPGALLFVDENGKFTPGNPLVDEDGGIITDDNGNIVFSEILTVGDAIDTPDTPGVEEGSGGGSVPAGTVSLLHFDTDFTDVGGLTWTNEGGAVSISSTLPKFGAGSAYFDGIGFLSTPGGTGTVWDFGTDAFTLEVWFKTTTDPNIRLMAHGNELGDSWELAKSSSGKVEFYHPSVVTLQSGGGFNDGNWHHVAVVRDTDSEMFYLFVDGLLADSASVANTVAFPTYSTDVKLGCHVNEGSKWIGFLDEFRLTQSAVWTEAFTPPTVAYGS